MKCPYCGEENPKDSRFCQKCGKMLPVEEQSEEMKEETAESAPSKADSVISQAAETGKEFTQKAAAGLNEAGNAIGEGINKLNTQFKNYQQEQEAARQTRNASEQIMLADGEQVVKEYQCTDTKEALGRLLVTNHRVIYTAQGSKSRIQMETKISDISALHIYYGKNYNLARILLGVLIIIIAISLPRYYTPVWLRLLLIALGIYLAATSCRRNYTLRVYSGNATGVPINLGEGAVGAAGNKAALSLTAQPGPDTERMMNELGAVVSDLQKMGDKAIAKWNV